MRFEGVYVQESVNVICWLDCFAFPGVYVPRLGRLQWLMIVWVVANLVLQMFSGDVEVMLCEDEGSVSIHCDRSMVPKQLFSQLSCGCAKCGECVGATFLTNVVLWTVSAGAICWSFSGLAVLVLCSMVCGLPVLEVVLAFFFLLLPAYCRSQSG